MVAVARSVVTLVGECKWTKGRMPLSVLEDLDAYKIPAMREGRIRFARDGPQIVLFSRGGFSEALNRLAEQRGDVALISVEHSSATSFRRATDHPSALSKVPSPAKAIRLQAF